MITVTGNIDITLIALYAFWIFFAGLLWYLRQEDRREGYPLESDVGGKYPKDAWFFMPPPKTFVLPNGGGTKQVPDGTRDTREIAASRPHEYPGAPLYPTGDPLVDGVGPASWAERSDTPDLMAEGELRIVPLRTSGGFSLNEKDPDPRGMEVYAADNVAVGTVTEVWVDRSECMVRYYELQLGSGENALIKLLPVSFGNIKRGRGRTLVMHVRAITSEQFARVPTIANPDRITRLEEERLVAYYGGGELYATRFRQEPLF
ncbi:MAG: photosynthetic reaction center subunit H [Pseudomonadota bacterium]